MAKDNYKMPYHKYFVKESQPKNHCQTLIHNINSSEEYEKVLATVSKRRTKNERHVRKLQTMCRAARKKTGDSKQVVENSHLKYFHSINSLFKVISYESVESINTELSNKVFDINVTDDYLWTPLMCACSRGDISIVELLLKRGAKIEVSDNAGNTPLSIAMQCNHFDIYKLLVKDLDEKISQYEENYQINEEKNSKQLLLCSDKCQNDPSPVKSEDVIKLNNYCDTKLVKLGFDSEEEKISSDVSYNEDIDVICISSDSDEEQNSSQCQLCNIKVLHKNYKEHLLSTVHQFYKQLKSMDKSKEKLIKPVDYGISEQNKGFQLLLKSGWTKQTGLGKFQSGIRAPIKTKIKNDRKGIGKKKQDMRNLHKVLPENNLKFNPRLREQIEKSKELTYRKELNSV